MGERGWVDRCTIVLAMVLVVAVSCTRNTYVTFCSPGDGGVGDGGDGGETRGGGDASDRGGAVDVKTGCSGNSTCPGDGGARVCDVDAGGLCVGCLARTDCTAPTPACDTLMKTCVECLATTAPGLDPDCKNSKPICQSQKCRACRSDAECRHPGICMTDGHCATEAEVVFVENKTGGCGPSPDGTSAVPYCLPAEGAAVMNGQRNVMVIRGAVDGRLRLSTSMFPIVIVGKKDAGSVGATIPAGDGIGITVSAGDALVRDLSVTAGLATNMSKGIVVSGSSTRLRLDNVTVNLGPGLGVQADAGSTLVMDRCVVQNSSAGGILINGATYDIQNSVIAGNDFGIQFAGAPIPSPSIFSFNTIVQNPGGAAFCDPNNRRTVSNSIVVGSVVSCLLVNAVVTAPTFSGVKPYRLTANLACPGGDPTVFPDHDIDGDARTATQLDCGADQFVP